jgi:hypothetical protein
MLTVGLGADQLASPYRQTIGEDPGGAGDLLPHHLHDLFHPVGIEAFTLLDEKQELLEDGTSLLYFGSRA